MVTEAFRVDLRGQTVAHLFARGDHTWLEWQDGYWDDPDRPVLGLWFEDDPRRRIASALRLPPWFSNLLPEGRLRDWVARDAGVSDQREMRLLVRLGRNLPGAVSIIPTSGKINPLWQPDGTLLPPALPLDEGLFRFSLAGVALKFSLLQVGDRLTLPASDNDGDWILKMPDAGYPSVPENEFAMMTLARLCGIDVPETRLWHRDELPELPDAAWPSGQDIAYGVRRFDRDQARRIHMEDLAQVRGFYPDDKYKGSFDTVANLIYRQQDLDSYLEFVRRLFFSFAIGNGDMHLKNVSLLYRDPRNPVISPAYDLVSTAPYRFPELEDLGLKLGRSRRFESIGPNSFSQLSQRVGAPVDPTQEVVAAVAACLPAAWEQVSDLMKTLPGHRKWLAERLPKLAQHFSS